MAIIIINSIVLISYYDEYGNKSKIEVDFGDEYDKELKILENQVKERYNKEHNGKYGLME
jgi:hypothetical protein